MHAKKEEPDHAGSEELDRERRPLGLWTEAWGGRLTGVPCLQKLVILMSLEGDGILQAILFTRLAGHPPGNRWTALTRYQDGVEFMSPTSFVRMG